MRTIAVVARKGGSGKTTLALHMAIAAHLRGLKVILADADAQRSSSEALRKRKVPGPKLVETASRKLFTLQEASRRAGDDLIIVDTPCCPDEEVSEAIGLSDLVLVVVRPSFFDVAAAVRSIDAARQLGRPAQIIINQAFSARFGKESAALDSALEALRFTGTPICPAIVHSRALFQSALAMGMSAEEMGPSAGAEEIAAVWANAAAPLVEAAQLKRA
jgi:chromosome partitioning protein